MFAELKNAERGESVAPQLNDAQEVQLPIATVALQANFFSPACPIIQLSTQYFLSLFCARAMLDILRRHVGKQIKDVADRHTKNHLEAVWGSIFKKLKKRENDSGDSFQFNKCLSNTNYSQQARHHWGY